MQFNETEMKEFGRGLAAELAAGDVVALIGDLGVGKTTLTKAVAEGLGVREQVTSPTFNIIAEYVGDLMPLYHFDVYRLNGSSELESLGYEEYFYGDGVCLVEWADKVADLIPEGAYLIEIGYGDSPGVRTVDVRRKGAD